MMFEMPLGFEIEYKGVTTMLLFHLDLLAVTVGDMSWTLAQSRCVTTYFAIPECSS